MKNQLILEVLKFSNARDYNNPAYIKAVCKFFDFCKDLEFLSQADLLFLKDISIQVGIPHYFDMLNIKFNKNTNIEDLNMNLISNNLYDSSLVISKNFKVHKYQKELLSNFKENEVNRFLLTAPTSFGKTTIMYEIIQKMKYKNVLLIFPTIALLSENYEKVHNNINLKRDYKIHTISDIEADKMGDKNIFIYTPERFSSFHDKNQDFRMDFVFIDEFYKIDNKFFDGENNLGESERDQVYRLASKFAILNNNDVLLSGPFMEINNENSFGKFLHTHSIKVLNYNTIEIVNKNYPPIKFKTDMQIKTYLSSNYKDGNILIYKYSKQTVKNLAIKLCEMSSDNFDIVNNEYKIFLEHIKNEFGKNWFLYKILCKGIAVHHGLIPKYIQKDLINFFNNGDIKIIVCTTTITEGVNTTAKKIIVTSSKKGKNDLKKFDAKNIVGRSGRFLFHYSGDVIITDKKFENILNSENIEYLEHKNYDIKDKNDIDIDNSEIGYLSTKDQDSKQKIEKEIKELKLDDYLFSRYKSISRKNKIELYKKYTNLTENEIKEIVESIRTFQSGSVDKNILDKIFNLLYQINIISKSDSKKIEGLIIKKDKNGQYSILSTFISIYLGKSFKDQILYLIREKHRSTDEAVNEVSDFTFNVLKYIIPKYLGLFDLVYRYCESKKLNKNPEEIKGFETFISKIEYGGAISERARIAYDYGCSYNVLKKVEEPNKNIILDKYEKKQFEKIKKLFN